ncbi:hypothetical protein [Hyperthermus butylicus]|uniref:hypothetical protein n=1 Tax=Hyperthermus butylicus TaxID=54248 RepID=UPI00129A8591|nr:hypothetical protein [Hyperthermus butylicus]
MAWRGRPETPCRIVVREIIVRGVLDEECSDVCPSSALVVRDGRVETDPSKCLVCLVCMALCGPAGW